MRLKMKQWWMLSVLLASILPTCFADEIPVIQGGDFTMACESSMAGSGLITVEVTYQQDDVSDKIPLAHYMPPTDSNTEMIRIFPGTQFSGRISFTGTSERLLTIADVMVSDEGTFSCVTTMFGQAEKKTLKNDLLVYVRPKVEARKLADYVTVGEKKIDVAVCSAIDGRPAAQVSWSSKRHLQFDQYWNVSGGDPTSTNMSTLNFAPTKFHNGMEFTCTITHPAFESGGNTSTIILDVRYPPETPHIMVIDKHRKLKCSAEGNPTPAIVWILPSSAPTSTLAGDTVQIVSPDDKARENDTYICTASNGMEPSSEAQITTKEAVIFVEMVNQSNTGVIVAAVVGTILLLVIIAALVYWFFIRKMQEKDEGPYNPKRLSRHEDGGGSNWQRSSGRPIIEHANESLHKHAPPSPSVPPPEDDDDGEASNSSHSDAEVDMDGHDVDLTAPLTNQEDDDLPTGGIVSKNSVNFRPYWRTSIATEHRRQRPSTSPHRMSQNRGPPEPTPRPQPQAEPHYEELNQRSDPHYEVPPQEYYDDEYGDEEPLAGGYHEEPDNRFYDRPEDRYPDYQQRYKPHQNEGLPPYSKDIQYASIDHGYNGREPRTRPPYQEPVEYAEIRSHGQIV